MFLDALDVMGYFIKSKLIILIMFMKLEAIIYLIDGYSAQIFDYFIQLDLYKIYYAKKYIEKAGNRFEQPFLEIKYLQLSKY